MAVKFQIVIDCTDPGRLTHFWATALGYRIPDPPDGYGTWRDFYLGIGVPEQELVGYDGADRLVDPDGAGPRFWFQQVPEAKVVKNRIHLDLDVGGGRGLPLAARMRRVDAEVERLVGAGASRLRVLDQEGTDHYAVAMADPEGNEFCVY